MRIADLKASSQEPVARIQEEKSRGQEMEIGGAALRALRLEAMQRAGMMETGNPLAGLSGAQRARIMMAGWNKRHFTEQEAWMI